MCFSPTASFASAGILASIGIATLRHVREPRTALFAAVPLLFAFHQFCEGMVWLGFEGYIGTLARDHFAFLFTLYAQGLLPLLMPAAVALMEPRGWRRNLIVGLTAIGAIACIWDAYGLIFVPSRVFVDHFSIAYRNPLTGNLFISLLYILATCGALVMSSHRVIRTYGIVNIIALTIVQLVRSYAFASVWCFYAAIMSVIIYRQFSRQMLNVSRSEGAAAPTL